MSKKEKLQLEKIRHSLSHLMSMAIMKIYPNTSLGIGPTIENGFYYDFGLSNPIAPEDLPKIEKRMRELIKKDLKFEKQELKTDEAIKLFRNLNQSYKIELINEIKSSTRYARSDNNYSLNEAQSAESKDEVTVYKTDNFVDLCRGPHVKSSKEINPKAFKLTKIAGAYWRGDEKKPMLTRVYGVAFEAEKDLDNYLKGLEEAEKRDHRKLGKELGLYVFSDIVGKGLPLWTEKGTVIIRELENFIIDEEIKRGYKHVRTPDIAKLDLYKKSGHYPYYKDSMYTPVKIDDEEFMLRPMSCPHHFELYLSKPRSYKELPLRIAEIAKLYRYEQSGELSGLIRVRSFCLADAHIFCSDKEQVEKEIKNALDLIEFALDKLGLKISKDYWYRLSLGDRKDSKKYYKNDKAWNDAEFILKKILKNRKCHFVEAKGEAAFYGPKIDIQMKNVLGKEDTAFTVQYDFVFPERFNLVYKDKNGKDKKTIIVHRSSIGAIERTIAFLIEHYAGAFPVWLSPVQVQIIPVADRHNKYAQKVAKILSGDLALARDQSPPKGGTPETGLRLEIKDQNETVSKKIREGELQKIPYMLVVGDKEEKAKSVGVRDRGKGDIGIMKIEKFIQKINKEIENKT